MNRRPRNYFLPHVPYLRANTFSGMEHPPRKNFLPDVPHLRANTFSGMERQPQNYFLPDHRGFAWRCRGLRDVGRRVGGCATEVDDASGAARRGSMACRELRDRGRWRVGGGATCGERFKRCGERFERCGERYERDGNDMAVEHDTYRARHTSSTTHLGLAALVARAPRLGHDTLWTPRPHLLKRSRHTLDTSATPPEAVTPHLGHLGHTSRSGHDTPWTASCTGPKRHGAEEREGRRWRGGRGRGRGRRGRGRRRRRRRRWRGIVVVVFVVVIAAVAAARRRRRGWRWQWRGRLGGGGGPKRRGG